MPDNNRLKMLWQQEWTRVSRLKNLESGTGDSFCVFNDLVVSVLIKPYKIDEVMARINERVEAVKAEGQ